MKYYIIAGEASGDLHAANLMNEIKILDKNAEFRVWGGNLMENAGGILVKHYKELAFMGFIEVLLNIRTISKNLNFCKYDLLKYKPDLLILVDYPGFNLRIAEFAHLNQIKIYYYISPKIWAWKKSRAFKIKKYIDKMFVIFPFEKDFYRQYNYEVEYLGNPILDEIESKKPLLSEKKVFLEKNKLENKPIIALLAGSRKQEISLILPEMLKVVQYYPAYQFIIAGAPSFNLDSYKPFINHLDIMVVFNQTYDLLKHADYAIVTSGTATLETALFGVPQVVVYKMLNIQYEIGKFFIKVKFFSLVNIIMDKQVVKEILQKDMENQIKTELDKMMNNPQYKNEILDNYKELGHLLGSAGASKRTAEVIIRNLLPLKQ
ncbi:MAG: lipid-A-disaccharide synthase [Bacteroidales bacterium]